MMENAFYYLVTKKAYYEKPTFEAVEKSIELMIAHAVENKVGTVSFPKLACGLDGHKWPRVGDVLAKKLAAAGIRGTCYEL